MAPAVVVFVLAGLMGLPFLRRAGLSRRELLVIYSLLLVTFVNSLSARVPSVPAVPLGPLAIGLVVGDLVNEGLWAAVALLTSGRV